MLLFAIMISAMGANAAESTPSLKYNDGGGYYEIATVEDMITFANFCRSAKSPTCVGMTFKVTASELDLGTDDFKRITGGFGGTFDGQGVVIKNLHKTSLFETIKEGTVMNITLDQSCEFNGDNGVGGIATNNESGLISGCINNGNAKGYARTSGILNYNNKGTVKDCVNNGMIHGESRNAAGIVGYNDGGTIENCFNYGTIIGDGGYCGGIVGSNHGKIVTISNCTNTGAIKSKNQNTGGISGDNGEKSTIQDCVNTGTVESPSYFVGGIVGISDGTILRCNNSGDVTCGDVSAGGIAGANDGETRQCINTGNVSAQSGCAGISGRSRGSIYDSEVSGCTISVTDALYAGAILGSKTHNILSENYYYSDVTVIVSSGSSSPKTYKGTTPRGRGATGVSNIYDPDDVYEMEAGGTKYYNGAVLKLRPGEVSFKLTYMVDNEVYKTYEVPYDDAITPEPAPTKEGYSFSGWSEIPERMPARDITVTGTFTVNKYKLSYIVDGQTYQSYDVEYGATITPEAAPTKEGYTFSEWEGLPATMPAQDVTVTAKFTINKYTLTYKVDDQVYATYEVEYGAAITPEDEPTKDGYTFSGWSEIPSTMPAKDITVTGTFSSNTFTLTYIVDGQTYKSYTMEYGESITPESAPEKEGYTFSEWEGLPATMPAQDVTATAKYTVNKYTLTYIVDGETYKTYEVEYGTSITPEAEPTMDGYTFSGWSEIPSTMPAYDVDVTGSFTANREGPNLNYNEEGMFFEIASVEDMNTFSRYVNGGKTNKECVGWTFKVIVDELDYKGKEYVKIQDVFSGTFDGQGVAFKNLSYEALFYVVKDGVVMNITIDASSNLDGVNSVGGITTTNDGGLITGCINNAGATGRSRVSGIVNENKKGIIRNCVNNGAITGTASNAAGIAGTNDGGTIEDCANYGTITGGGYCGGIVGSNTAKGVISNSENAGDVISSGQDTGGVAGNNDAECTIQGCNNSGTIESKDYFVGGIVGITSGLVKECMNSGTVTGKDSNNGGVAGANDGTIRGCINTGDVSGQSNCGGIAGRPRGDVYDSQVSGCTIAANDKVGAGAIIGGGSYGILSENYYESDVKVSVKAGEVVYSGSTPRGRGSSGVGGNDPEDVYEMTANGVKYYNGAVLKGSSDISSKIQGSETTDIFTLDGKRVENPQRGGVYIIKNNGSAKKIMVK